MVTPKKNCFLCELPADLRKQVIALRKSNNSFRKIATFLGRQDHPISHVQLSRVYEIHMKEHHDENDEEPHEKHHEKFTSLAKGKKNQPKCILCEIPPELLATLLEKKLADPDGFSFQKMATFLTNHGYPTTKPTMARHYKIHTTENHLQKEPPKIQKIKKEPTKLQKLQKSKMEKEAKVVHSSSISSTTNNYFYEEFLNKKEEYDKVASQKISFANQRLSPRIINHIVKLASMGIPLRDIAHLFQINENILIGWLNKGQEKKNPLCERLYIEFLQAKSEFKVRLLGIQAATAMVGDVTAEKVHVQDQVITARGEVIPVTRIHSTSKIKTDPKSREALLKELNANEFVSKKVMKKLQSGEYNVAEATFSLLEQGEPIPKEILNMLPKQKIDPPVNMQERYTEEELEEETLETYQHLIDQKEIVIPERKRKIEEMKEKLNQGDEYLDSS